PAPMPPIIETRDLRKVFRTLKRQPGIAGTLRTLFSRDYEDKVAVEGITMSLEAGELLHVDAPLRIVVDDAHVLGASFGAFAGALVRRMPPAVRLVLLTRAPLDVGLPEAIAAGRGTLIDAAALRFDAARVRAVAAELGVVLDDAGVDALLSRTDGWPIAVALALRAPDASDALLEELVARRLDALGGGDRALLAATLAYEIVEPAVAFGDAAAAAVRFNALADDGALVARVRGGYRVHPLVREALARDLDAATLARRHAEAARAYLHAKRLRPALFHLARARDPALDVAFLRGDAAAAVASGLVDGVRDALARTHDAAPRGVVALVEGLLAKARGGDARRAFADATAAAEDENDRELAFEARLQAVEADLAHGDPVEPRQVDDLLARAAAFGRPAQVKALVRAGWADALAGRFADALARLDAAGGADPALLADVAPLAAYAFCALGDFESGERAASALVDAWSGSDDVVRYVGALGWAARFALLRGETTAAYELAREAERIARPFALRAQSAAMQATLAEAALHVGDTALARTAARAAVRGADAAWYSRDAERARTLGARIQARAAALEGDPAAALTASGGADPLSTADAALFATLLDLPDAAARRSRARAALSEAMPLDGDDAVALLAAAELLDALDARAGIVVTTPLRAGPFDGLIVRRRDADAGPRFETQILARLAGRAAPPRTDAPIEPLTAREHEILALLAAGLTNREIAQRLVVSARTVETHVARVTGKLGVNSRARAVARAVALGIVAPPAVAV
ncbi:MAG TPA: LuxR C-terminal-related transcriptional regulator, partial [Candidatus Elarobacter sp.]